MNGQPTILVIVGITGDLSRRKLMPAIEQLARAEAVPEKFKIIGVTRRDVSVAEALEGVAADRHDFLSSHLDMYQMDLTNLDDYKKLNAHLAQMELEFGGAAQRLFYLSVPPQISQPVVELLGESGLAGTPMTKLLLEKPFGTDLESAQDLINQTKKHFEEGQVYRIDHYLAKEMSQNIVVFREGNSLFKRAWNKDFIESITIIASEKIGIEGRATFYEQTGALRDFVQSHLLQLAALTLMDTPAVGHLGEVPRRRLKALRGLHAPAGKSISEYALRGQYDSYRTDISNPSSMVETYVRLTLESDDPKWEGVPIHLITGKALDKKATEIRITYKKDREYESNELIIKLQPDEGAELRLWTKVPGYEWKVEQHSLGIAFKDHYDTLPEAYEQVILDAIRSDHTLFTSSEEVMETWRILAPVQKAWSMSDAGLEMYVPGSKGPL